MKRAIQHLVLNELSKTLIGGKVNRQQPIIVDVANGAITFRN